MSSRFPNHPRTDRRVRRIAVAGLVAMTSVGCTVGPDYHRPLLTTPGAFKSATTTGDQPVRPEWWREYGDPELDRLVTIADASNQTLRQAIAAVDQGRALARVASSYRYPTIALGSTLTRQRTSGSRVSPASGQAVESASTFSDWLVPISLSYEIDVWGRVRRSIESARADAVASADDEAAIRLAVHTDVAQYYFTIRSLDAQAALLDQTLASYREQVRLLSAQVANGLASALVVHQAEAQLESTTAQRRDMVRARADEEHALAVLCGQPAPTFSVAVSPLPDAPPPAIPAALPAMLLTRRPDVAASEQRVVAANARVGVAVADLYPTFSLTSTAGFESANLRTLFDWRSRLASIVPGVVLPIFQGGRNRANLDAARAEYRQTVAAYVNQVLDAYRDVEDALTDRDALDTMVGDYQRAATAASNYHRLALVQYKTGLADYLTVIDAERTLLAARLSLAQAGNLRHTASIRLVKALGGGWQPR